MAASQTTRPLAGKRRPIEIYALIGGALLLSTVGWLRVQQAVVYWDWITPPLFPFPAWYVAAGGILWGLAGLAAAGALWSRYRRAAQITRLTACFYALSYWLDRLVFTRSLTAWANWLFSLGLTIAALGFVFGVLQMRRQKRYLAYREQNNEKLTGLNGHAV